MSMKRPALAGLAAGVAVLAAGCASGVPAQAPPARTYQIAGSPVQRLELTGQAVQRLGITTQPVREVRTPARAGRGPVREGRTAAGKAGVHKVIPYSAVVYDTDGSTWTYVNTAARTYLRERIAITEIRGDIAILSSGPPVGTAVVTVGAAELLGTEYHISGEE